MPPDPPRDDAPWSERPDVVFALVCAGCAAPAFVGAVQLGAHVEELESPDRFFQAAGAARGLAAGGGLLVLMALVAGLVGGALPSDPERRQEDWRRLTSVCGGVGGFLLVVCLTCVYLVVEAAGSVGRTGCFLMTVALAVVASFVGVAASLLGAFTGVLAAALLLVALVGFWRR